MELNNGHVVTPSADIKAERKGQAFKKRLYEKILKNKSREGALLKNHLLNGVKKANN